MSLSFDKIRNKFTDSGGGERWYDDDQLLHREIRPAVKGDKFTAWYIHGSIHREDGPAIEWADGGRDWYKDGKRHREDGPAMKTHQKTLIWYKDGKRHREDGPAVIRKNGTVEWFINNKKLNFDRWLELTPISEEEKLMIKLEYA